MRNEKRPGWITFSKKLVRSGSLCPGDVQTMTNSVSKAEPPPLPKAGGEVTYWRVEGSLLELGAMRPVGFFTWNSRSFAERWARRAGMAGNGPGRPFAYSAD